MNACKYCGGEGQLNIGCKYCVVCENCLARTYDYKTGEDAIKAWNFGNIHDWRLTAVDDDEYYFWDR